MTAGDNEELENPPTIANSRVSAAAEHSFEYDTSSEIGSESDLSWNDNDLEKAFQLKKLMKKTQHPELKASDESSFQGHTQDRGLDEDSLQTRRAQQGNLSKTHTDKPYFTADEEKTLVRKFDKRVVLFLAILYMLSFLDRSSTSLKVLPFRNVQGADEMLP